MRKFYLFFLAAFTVTSTQAQKQLNTKNHQVAKFIAPIVKNRFVQGNCDVFNVSEDWVNTPYTYLLDDAQPYDSGYATGLNRYKDKQKAQYFDGVGTSYTYISAAEVWFNDAYATDKTLQVPIHVYAADGDGSSPGTLLGTSNLTMGQIMDDVDSLFPSVVVFKPALALPTKKRFFISVDMTNLNIKKTDPDVLGILGSDFDVASGAWDQVSDGSWLTFADDWSSPELAFYIFPVLSIGENCDLLPVNLQSFHASAKGKNAILNWQVAQESNMKGYDVERSEDGRLFKTIGSVAATNTSIQHSYSFTDEGALNTSSLLYYRLKTLDKDGTASYSKIITLSSESGSLSVKVVNPFRNVVQLQVNAPTAQKLQGAIYDMQGRKVATAPAQALVAGQNTITILAGNLPKGVYLLNITVGKNTLKYKIVN